jgi:ATP-dependent DNA helicase RecG
MDEHQIKEIISHKENQEVEFKQSFHSAQDVSKTLCAFANTLGGILFIGVDDKEQIVGISENIDKLQQNISAANQSVSPVPLISIEVYRLDGKSIVVVVVQKSPDNSYHTFQGAIYVRNGSTTRRIEGNTHLEFLRNRQILSFDETIDMSCKVEDLDIEKIKKYLKARKQDNYFDNHSIEEFLLSSKLATKNGYLKIKNPAILLFAKNPTFFHPQIELKLVQFSGVEPVNILSHKLIQEDLMDAIEQSMSFIEKNLSRKIEIKSKPQHEETFEYPLNVIREAVVNAIAHRDYFSKDAIQIYLFDDRIEITNPGSLPHNLPKELFGTISVQRNPITYRFLRDMGYVEGLGTGIPRMKNAMRQANLSDPDFKFTESFFRLILYNAKGNKKPIEGLADLNDKQKKALEYLKKHKSLKAKTYAEINKVSHATAVNEINELIQYKYIKKVGAFRGAYYVLESNIATQLSEQGKQ